jgi:hypothetical protein
MSTNTFAPSGVSDAEAASRIAALRRHREERAASSGVGPAVVRMTVDDITDVLDGLPRDAQASLLAYLSRRTTHNTRD